MFQRFQSFRNCTTNVGKVFLKWPYQGLVKAENIVKVDEQLKTLKSNIPTLLDAYPLFEEFDK